MTDDRQLEALLRRGMADEVRPVVAESRLTEQIIAAAGAEPAPAERASWQNWVVPAVAAVLVALLVGSVLFGAKLLHSSGPSPAGHRTPPATPALSASPSSPVPDTSASPGPSASQGRTPAAPSPGTGPVPAGFTGYDLSWVSRDEGWALGTAPCATAPCTSIVHTLDGGRTWGGLPAPAAFLSQADTCTSACDRVSGIRFADARTGYVFGPNSFWMTTDGGRSWQRQPGNAWALEVVAGRVLRVSGVVPNCAPGCRFVLQQAAPGSTGWQDVSLPGAPQDVGASLSANGNNVVLASYGNPAGGADNAQSVVFRSSDGGQHWQRIGEPCPQGQGEVDATAVTVGADGSVSAACRPRTAPGGQPFEVTAADGNTFHTVPVVPGGFPGGTVSALAATAADNLLVGGDQLYRWDGAAWHQAPGPQGLRFIGFESRTVGRALAANGVWMTTDAGASWVQLSY